MSSIEDCGFITPPPFLRQAGLSIILPSHTTTSGEVRQILSLVWERASLE